VWRDRKEASINFASLRTNYFAIIVHFNGACVFDMETMNP
jgi:hypothetical protein